MRHSVLFMRLTSLVVGMILMTALLTTVIYNFISQRVFTGIKEEIGRAHV